MDEQTMHAWAANFASMMVELGKAGRELADEVGVASGALDERDQAFFDEAVSQIMDLGIEL